MPGWAALLPALWNELTHPQYSGLSVAEVLELGALN